MTQENHDSIVYLDASCAKSNLLFNNIKHNKQTILYQLEPLVENHWWKISDIVEVAQKADEVWDYDLQNIEILRDNGIDAKFKPIVYTNKWKRINKRECDIDVLFYGTMTKFRYKIYNNFLEHMPIQNDSPLTDIYVNKKVIWAYAIFDELLDELISRSKIIVNLNPYEGETRQQQTRIAYALNNDKLVLSQKSPINYFGDSILQFDDERSLNDLVLDILYHKKWELPDISNRPNIFNKSRGKKIAIFYHVHQKNDWKRIFEEQIVALQQSGVYDAADYIHIGVNGNEPLPYILNKVACVKYNKNIHLEADTIKNMHSFCLSNPDYKVLYIHAKGVNYANEDAIKNNIELWRKYLEYFTIKNWNKCYDLLNEYDCAGTEWETEAHIGDTKSVIPHYAGNFWWANASYINKLDVTDLFVENEWTRWKAEFWIGTGNPNYYNFYTTGRNKYGYPIPPEEYTHIEKGIIKMTDTNNKQLNDRLEVIKSISQITSGWTGHTNFAQWIVNELNPSTIVELGVDYGLSTLSFAIPNKGTIFGIDNFSGDHQTGFRNTEEFIRDKIKQLNIDNIVLIKTNFDDAVKFWNKPIDILHIDGLHTYDAVKNDYQNWSRFVKEDGVILLHDTCITRDDFGVYKFFEEIDLPKINFKHSCGLGVVSKNPKIIERIRNEFF